ncbi:C1orf87 [Branchiostoma lanceolatum]|uniref:C1orf87 protein n=1 Tax=Branchiostoma lanceolatum TaxID=7740 RepID=A0A8K0EC32_BRALA|nr:C1orf87 [Branchiostoma lanceolatum]
MSMARNAPFGTDDTPEIEVKIIGSKRVQVLRDKTKKHGNPLLAPLPDSPSLLTQPLYKEYENLSSSHIKQGYTTTDQHERAKLVPSQTAQADKSNSQLHGTNNLKVSSKVLPPISRSSTSSDGSGGGQSSILGEDPTIANQLHKILKKYDSKKFKDMYVELVGYDRNLTGYVNQSQLNLVCLRHQLPLSGSTLQIMFSRFASTEDEESINYEKLLQFLSAAQQNKPVKQSTLSATVEKFVGGGGDSTSSSQKSKAGSQTAPELRIRQKSHMQENMLMSPGSGLTSPSISLPQTTSTIDGLKPESPVARHRTGSFSDREAAKLVHLLENQFTALEAEDLDLQAVRNTFEEVDRQRAGMLSRKQLEDVVVKHRLPIQGSLMEKLLKRCEVEAGLFSWKTLVEFLERVKPLEIPSKQKQGVKRPGTWPRNKNNLEKSFLPPSVSPEVPKPPPWETRKPLERLEKRPTQLSPEEPQIERISHTGNTSSGGLSQGTNEDEMSPRNSLEDSQRDLDKLILAAREKQRARGKAAMHLEEGEDWDQRFLHLDKALFNCDELGSGFLELLEAKRLVRNYNLIYNLGFEDARIENTLTQCSADGKVALEPLIQSLRVKL